MRHLILKNIQDVRKMCNSGKGLNNLVGSPVLIIVGRGYDTKTRLRIVSNADMGARCKKYNELEDVIFFKQ